MDEFLDAARRRNDELRRKVVGAFRRGWGALTPPVGEDRTTERKLLEAQLRAAVDEIAAVTRKQGEEMREAMQASIALERQVVDDRIRSALDELASLTRAQGADLREVLRTSAERDLSALTLVTQAVAELGALSRRQHDEMRELLQRTSEQHLQALGQVAEALKEVAAASRTIELPTRPALPDPEAPPARATSSSTEGGWSALL